MSRSSASTSARVRSRWLPSSDSSRASAISAPFSAISSHSLRCSRGWCWARSCCRSARPARPAARAPPGMAQHQQAGRRHAQVVLGDEGFQHLLLHRQRAAAFLGLVGGERGAVVHMGREVGAVAQVAAAAHHGQVDAGAAALHLHGQHVDIAVAPRSGCSLPCSAGAAPATARRCGCAPRRPLEFQRVGIGHHLRLQVPITSSLLAQQKALGIAARRARSPRA
jgi:hypothetical protein